MNTLISWCWFLHHFLVKTVYRLFHFFSNNHPERTLCGGRVVSTQEQTKQPPKSGLEKQLWSARTACHFEDSAPDDTAAILGYPAECHVMYQEGIVIYQRFTHRFLQLKALDNLKLHRRVERRVTQRKTIKHPSKSNNTSKTTIN